MMIGGTSWWTVGREDLARPAAGATGRRMICSDLGRTVGTGGSAALSVGAGRIGAGRVIWGVGRITADACGSEVVGSSIGRIGRYGWVRSGCAAGVIGTVGGATG